jgi:hypothetical protein
MVSKTMENNTITKHFKTNKMKQERLEEVAEIKFQNVGDRLIFEDGKWQSEKMYSEEEVFNLLMEFSSRDINSSSRTPHSVANWFEQFKKK